MLATLASRAQEPGFPSQMMNLISTLSARSAMGATAGGGSSAVGGRAQAGSTFLKMLFGNNLSDIENKIAEFWGMRASSAGNILSMAAPMVLDTLASKVNSGGLSASGLGNLLTSELPSLRSFLPAGNSIPDLPSVTSRMSQVAEIVDIKVQNPRRNREKVATYSSFVRADLIFFMLIMVFGSSSVLLHRRTADFLGEDVFFADAAQSLLHHGFYGVNGNSETTMPPGLSGILAVLFSIFGYSHSVCVGAMAVFEALGFLVAYEVLRRRVSRLVAATICILLLSSPLYFSWATRIVAPCFPYFFTTMVALQSGEEYDKAATTRSRIIWGTALTVAVAASLLIATGTIALLGAIAAVTVLTALQDRRLARTRLLKFLPVFLVGIAVQGLWMHRKPAPPEWSLRGYPGSYLEQIILKSGNQPELGLAKWSDIPVRVTTNLTAESDIFAELVLLHGINRTKVALIIIPVLLIAIGWIYSIWMTRGMELVEWYFAGYEFIYMLWPWTMEPRFFLPVAPLACLYMWQAIRGVLFASRAKPRVVGIIWFPAALLLTILGAHSVYTNWPW